MALSPFLTILRSQGPRAFFQISGDWKALLRMHFLHAARDSGLLSALSAPRTEIELVTMLGVECRDLLRAILELGVSLGELSRKEGRYRVKGSRSKALQAPSNDALAAMVEANVTYYNDMFRSFPGRVRGGPLDGRIRAIGPLVARVSRIAEPFVEHFLRNAVRGSGPLRILDVGCGAGHHLRAVLEANPAATGVGLDLDPAVVSQCRENLEDWGLSGRSEVLEGDIQAPPEKARGPFHLVLLLSVVYYLPVPQRVAVLTDLRQRLTPGGVLVVITSCRGEGSDLFSANLNLATSSMEGLTPLPEADEMEAQLREAGFTRVRRERLIAGTTYFGFRAS